MNKTGTYGLCDRKYGIKIFIPNRTLSCIFLVKTSTGDVDTGRVNNSFLPVGNTELVNDFKMGNKPSLQFVIMVIGISIRDNTTGMIRIAVWYGVIEECLQLCHVSRTFMITPYYAMGMGWTGEGAGTDRISLKSRPRNWLIQNFVQLWDDCANVGSTLGQPP